MKTHCIELTVRNHPGVLCQVTGLIWRKRLALESFHFPSAEDPERRSLYLTFSEKESLEKVFKNLEGLYDVLLARKVEHVGFACPELEPHQP